MAKLVLDSQLVLFRVEPVRLPHAYPRTLRIGHSKTLQAAKSQGIDYEVVEVLRSIGMSSETAGTLLQDPKCAHTTTTSVSDVCRALADVVRIPVAELGNVLGECPEILAAGSTLLLERYDSLRSAWPSERKLQSDIRRYPFMLEERFLPSLQRFMSTLKDLGFSEAQVAAAVVRAPNVATLRRYEILNALKRCGIDLSEASPGPVFKLLSRAPQCMSPHGCEDLKSLLDVLSDNVGLPWDTAVIAVADCPRLLVTPIENIERNIRILKNWGFSDDETAQIVAGWPPVLRVRSKRLRMTLEFFRKNGIKTASVVQYPRAFTHDPLRVVGPRLAYLSEHDADRCVEHVNDFWSAFESELLCCSFALKKTLNRYLPSVFENISLFRERCIAVYP